MVRREVLRVVVVSTLASCARRDFTRGPASEAQSGVRDAQVFIGEATWYGSEFSGRRTASGERFDPRRMTAAHRFLPFGTWVQVTSFDTGARVRVRITDRGPFGAPSRIIDLSRAAAVKLGMTGAGVARVEVRVVSGP
jgi:rare lipoprotein A